MHKLLYVLIFVVCAFARNPPKILNARLVLLPYRLKQIINTIPASNNCITQLKTVLQAINSEKIWALEMLDATAKPMPGWLNGNLQQIGNYDQCSNIKRKINSNEIIEGKYCTAVALQVNATTPLSITSFPEYTKVNIDQYEDRLSQLLFTWDFCIPAVCSVNDLQLIVESVVKRLNLNYMLQFSENLCYYKSQTRNFNSLDYFAIAFLGAFFVLIASCTLCDLLNYERTKSTLQIEIKNESSTSLIRAFSLYANAKSLLFSQSGEDSLACISGLKAISITWIVIGHHFLLAFYMPTFNSLSKFDFLHEPESTAIIGSTLAVETFFVITGLLVSYNFFKMQERGFKVTVTYFYLHRILRLMPALAVLILLYASLLRFVGDGPLWILWRHVNYETCRKSWWWNLLFIQNYNKSDRCLHHGWYLSVDTQLYALSPLFLFSFMRHPKKVIITLLGLIATSTINVFVISYTNQLGVNLVHDKTENLIYLPTHLRASSYLLGSILGYIIFTFRFVPVKINQVLVKLFWATSLTLLMYLPYLHFCVSKQDNPNILQAALLNSLSRPLWGLCICWIIYACVTGYGKIINRFLALPIFTILSRVTYSMYLTHMMVLQIIMYQNRGPLYFSKLYLYRNAIGDYFFVCLVAIAWNLCFESPILVAEKILLRKGMQQMLKSDKYEKNETIAKKLNRNLVD